MRARIPLDDVRTPRDLAPLLEHTVLAPTATREDVACACAEALAHGFGAVCVHRNAITEVRRHLGARNIKAVAVVDFPRGEGATAARVVEAMEAMRAGADELDVVAPLPAVLAGRWEAVLEDLRAIVRAAPIPLKVILETGRLTLDQKVATAAVARCAGVAFVKTSTGFGAGGATVEDVTLLRAVVGDEVGVKASGGIRTAADALAMVRAGASRIGASGSVAIVTGSF
jgi:deoxyribose-phosphate aldolase